MASSERIFELLDTEQEPIGGSHTQDQATGEIEFDSVWFAYQGEDWVLKDVSFRIAPGELPLTDGAQDETPGLEADPDRPRHVDPG